MRNRLNSIFHCFPDLIYISKTFFQCAKSENGNLPKCTKTIFLDYLWVTTFLDYLVGHVTLAVNHVWILWNTCKVAVRLRNTLWVWAFRVGSDRVCGAWHLVFTFPDAEKIRVDSLARLWVRKMMLSILVCPNGCSFKKQSWNSDVDCCFLNEQRVESLFLKWTEV